MPRPNQHPSHWAPLLVVLMYYKFPFSFIILTATHCVPHTHLSARHAFSATHFSIHPSSPATRPTHFALHPHSRLRHVIPSKPPRLGCVFRAKVHGGNGDDVRARAKSVPFCLMHLCHHLLVVAINKSSTGCFLERESVVCWS